MDLYVCAWLSPIPAHLKLWQLCSSAIPQYKLKVLFKKRINTQVIKEETKKRSLQGSGWKEAHGSLLGLHVMFLPSWYWLHGGYFTIII